MKELGLKLVARMKKYRSHKGTVDITEYMMFEKKLYLSPVWSRFTVKLSLTQ